MAYTVKFSESMIARKKLGKLGVMVNYGIMYLPATPNSVGKVQKQSNLSHKWEAPTTCLVFLQDVISFK